MRRTTIAQFNRHGEAFDRGETFSGVDFETGLRAVEELKSLAPKNATLAQLALRWILEFPAVTCAIPGAKRPAQVAENIAASDLPPLSAATMKKIRAIYDRGNPSAGASLLVNVRVWNAPCLKQGMSGPDYPEHPADEIRAADEQRNKGRKFIGLSATCLIFIVCLAYVSHLFSGHRFSFFDFSGLVLFLLFIVVVDRIVLPRLDSLRQPESLAEQDVAADGKIRALLDGLPAGCVVLHDVNTGEASIDHLVFRKDGAVFLDRVPVA